MKKLTIENWIELAPYMQQADYHEYNSNPMTHLMWKTRYEVFFETFDTFALCYVIMPNHGPVWLMPFCTMDIRMQAMEKIKELSNTYNIPFGIHSMTKAFKDWLIQQYPLQFLVWDCYDVRDYIYDRQQQASLSGKKMQKRRNHFNAFLKQHEGRYLYKPIEQQDIPHIFALLEEWTAQKEEDISIHAEREGITFFLDHMDTLPIRGGCIYIDGKLEAFNITSMLSKDMVQIHVEKANKNIRGLYIAILKLFLETLPEEVEYVNREDDMGLEELRKAKKDMHPIYKVQKLGCKFQPLQIHKATSAWKDAMQKLWLQSFPDEDETSTQVFFEQFYHADDAYLLTYDNHLIAMAQIRQMQVMLDQTQHNARFIYGVACDPAYEHCGYMKTLLQHVIVEAYKTCSYIYIQAYNWDVYASFDFTHSYKKAVYKVNLNAYEDQGGTFLECLEASSLLACYQAFVADKNGYRIRDEAYYEELFLPYAKLCKQTIMTFHYKERVHGYIQFYIHDQQWHIQECIYDTPETLSKMLGKLSSMAKSVYITLPYDTTIEGRRKEEICMKVKTNQAHFPNTALYISESL